jgi:hypothetical protein
MRNRFLNGGTISELVVRDLVEPFGRVSVVSIKPKILRFRTAKEKEERKRRVETSVQLVRNYINARAQDAMRSYTGYAQRFTKRQLAELPLLAYGGHGGLEFVIAKMVFYDKLCGRRDRPQMLLKHLRNAGFLNEGKNGKVYVRREFGKPLCSASVVSIKPAIMSYKTTYEKEQAEARRERQRARPRHRRQYIRKLPRVKS